MPPCISRIALGESFALVCLLFTSPALASAQDSPGSSLPAPEAYVDRSEYFTQVTDDAVGRVWKTGPQELPPIESIVSAPAGEYPVYGIYCWGGEFTRAHEEILKMGFRSARLSGPWNESEEALKIAAREGIDVLYTVVNAQRRVAQRGWKRSDFESDEAYINDFLETTVEFLEKYGPDGSLFKGTELKSTVSVIEVLNEPNFHYMIPDREPVAEVFAERFSLYGRLLAKAIPVIREKAPSIKIAAFSAGGGGPIVADVPLVEAVTADFPDIHQKYDIFTTHPYMQGAPPEVFKIKKWGPRAMSQNQVTLREIFAKGGAAEKPIWFSELGFPVYKATGGRFDMPVNSAVFRITPDIQAAYIVRQYLWAMRLGVGRVHLMSLFDTDNFNSGILIREDLAWRPAAHAIKNLTTLLPNPKMLAAISDGENDTYIYRFHADHKDANSPEVVVAWNVNGPTSVEIPSDAKSVTAFDLIGNEKSLPVADGKTSVTIGPFPIFLLAARS